MAGTDIPQFIARTKALCARTGVAETTLSRKLLGNGRRLAELESGKSLRVDTLLKANAALTEMEAAA